VAACGGRSRPRCDSLLWESGMVRDTTDVKRRVMTQPLVVRNHKPLHGWFATALFLAGALASSGVAAAIGEQFCTHGGQDPQKGDSVACYSDAGCRFAASLGAEPVRNFSPGSAPFALARGKITGIILIVFRLDHSNQKSGRLVPQNLAAEPKSKLRWRTLAQGRPRQP